MTMKDLKDLGEYLIEHKEELNKNGFCVDSRKFSLDLFHPISKEIPEYLEVHVEQETNRYNLEFTSSEFFGSSYFLPKIPEIKDKNLPKKQNAALHYNCLGKVKSCLDLFLNSL